MKLLRLFLAACVLALSDFLLAAAAAIHTWPTAIHRASHWCHNKANEIELRRPK
jgi:hypothetical protein